MMPTAYVWPTGRPGHRLRAGKLLLGLLMSMPHPCGARGGKQFFSPVPASDAVYGNAVDGRTLTLKRAKSA